MASLDKRWDPEIILGVSLDNPICSGDKTPGSAEKCGCPLTDAGKEAFALRVERLSHFDPRHAPFMILLEHAARASLCAYHEDQAPDIKNNWLQELQKLAVFSEWLEEKYETYKKVSPDGATAAPDGGSLPEFLQAASSTPGSAATKDKGGVKKPDEKKEENDESEEAAKNKALELKVDQLEREVEELKKNKTLLDANNFVVKQSRNIAELTTNFCHVTRGVMKYAVQQYTALANSRTKSAQIDDYLDFEELGDSVLITPKNRTPDSEKSPDKEEPKIDWEHACSKQSPDAEEEIIDLTARSFEVAPLASTTKAKADSEEEEWTEIKGYYHDC